MWWGLSGGNNLRVGRGAGVPPTQCSAFPARGVRERGVPRAGRSSRGGGGWGGGGRGARAGGAGGGAGGAPPVRGTILGPSEFRSPEDAVVLAERGLDCRNRRRSRTAHVGLRPVAMLYFL